MHTGARHRFGFAKSRRPPSLPPGLAGPRPCRPSTFLCFWWDLGYNFGSVPVIGSVAGEIIGIVENAGAFEMIGFRDELIDQIGGLL